MLKHNMMFGSALGVLALLATDRTLPTVEPMRRAFEPLSDADLEKRAKRFMQFKEAETTVWTKAQTKRQRRQERNLRHVGSHNLA